MSETGKKKKVQLSVNESLMSGFTLDGRIEFWDIPSTGQISTSFCFFPEDLLQLFESFIPKEGKESWDAKHLGFSGTKDWEGRGR